MKSIAIWAICLLLLADIAQSGETRFLKCQPEEICWECSSSGGCGLDCASAKSFPPDIFELQLDDLGAIVAVDPPWRCLADDPETKTATTVTNKSIEFSCARQRMTVPPDRELVWVGIDRLSGAYRMNVRQIRDTQGNLLARNTETTGWCEIVERKF